MAKLGQSIPIKLGISETFDCSYLPNQSERLVIALDEVVYNPESYEQLMQIGFRRSGEQVYRPYCESCQACQSVRIRTDSFKPSRSQKRLLKKANHFTVKLQPSIKDPLIYYPLYKKYIELRHSDGSMYPPSEEQFSGFVKADWLTEVFLEIYDADKLIAVSVLDLLPHALSAVYTFFDPDYQDHSPGTLAILKATQFCQSLKLDYLYLGYQVDDCRKMNYKTKFKPYQRLEHNVWVEYED
ncbi:arginyltransferase [Catenovulum sp. SM1970]|uniref:arginyltransferase n=1 Tax=Marinifaba aquimaris TaxID=2741323 RepID=UPI001573DE62|nr:arginyltransferase [Marinifaba aquimaris]NTS77780.1 arginyltransferase [Marinifaba aquimaris]